MSFPSPTYCQEIALEISDIDRQISELQRLRRSAINRVKNFSPEIEDLEIHVDDRKLINTGISIAVQRNVKEAYFTLPYRGEIYRQAVDRELCLSGWTVTNVTVTSGRDEYKICYSIQTPLV